MVAHEYTHTLETTVRRTVQQPSEGTALRPSKGNAYPAAIVSITTPSCWHGTDYCRKLLSTPPGFTKKLSRFKNRARLKKLCLRLHPRVPEVTAAQKVQTLFITMVQGYRSKKKIFKQ
uniref:Uncharacterized protein n=1 Tax=Rhipicephalus microplus TaxID=6941 RepID=A0A6G5AIS6_RHIMP